MQKLTQNVHGLQRLRTCFCFGIRREKCLCTTTCGLLALPPPHPLLYIWNHLIKLSCEGNDWRCTHVLMGGVGAALKQSIQFIVFVMGL